MTKICCYCLGTTTTAVDVDDDDLLMINEQQATTEIPQNRKTKQNDDAKARSKLLLMFLAVGKIYLYTQKYTSLL